MAVDEDLFVFYPLTTKFEILKNLYGDEICTLDIPLPKLLGSAHIQHHYILLAHELRKLLPTGVKMSYFLMGCSHSRSTISTILLR